MDAKTLASIVLLSALAASVQGNLPDNTMVNCRTMADCSDPIGQNMTLRECCLGDGKLAFNFNGTCSPCIVIGWLNDSFTGKEQNENYVISAGYIKGADQARVNLVLEVKARSGTAKAGFNNDYILLTPQVIAPFRLNLPPPEVQFNFLRDGIALESNETLSLELILDNRTKNQLMSQEGLIIKNVSNLTILDSDSVQINFLENDYSTDEKQDNGSAGVLDITIVKSAPIASQVDLMIIPITVDKANSSGGPLPVEIPGDNPFSPNKASEKDFDETVMTVTFEPDENGPAITLKHVFIPVIDDLIDEAMEQVFVLQLSTSNTRVDLSVRPATLCKILDNDDITIGFVQSEYNYFEPMRDTDINRFYEPQANESGPVFLEKVGDVQTEQTFRISIQTSTVSGVPGIQSATLGEDYIVGEAIVLQILPNEQRINFPFELLHDDLPEGTEAFEASSSSDITPVVLNNISHPVPKYTTSESFKCLIKIEDDDPIVIGFEKNYTVNESIGTLNVAVKVIKPPDGEELQTLVQVNVQTVSGTATGDIDYTSLFGQDVILFFNDNFRRDSFEVDITDDSFFESTENFTLKLSTLTSGVELVPELATIDILDDDDIIIGFERTSYDVDEFARTLTVVVKVFSPPVGEDLPAVVTLNAGTVSGTATGGGVDYTSLSDVILVFDDDSRTASFNVTITNDTLAESTESFTLELMLDSSTTDRVMIDPEEATINIIDDERVHIHFTEDDFSADEAGGVCNVTIVKSIGIASPVVLTVTPLTVDDAFASRGPTPPNSSIPHDNPYSPNKASREDFNNTVIPITFDPDESRSVKQVSIPIVDDVINEADEQVFVVQLTSSNTEIDLSVRPATLCRIRDNDPISIGFEKSEYTYSEPIIETFIDETDDNPIFLQKEGGVVTEQTFVIAVQRSSDVPSDRNIRPATQGEDYVLPEASLYMMPPNLQEINVPFTLHTDDLPEATEGFKISSSPDITPQMIGDIAYEVPSYSNPQSLSDETFVIIMDDDSIVIGFENTSYTVNESIGTLGVVVKVFNIPDDEALPAPVSLNFLTVNGTATGEDDYEELDDLLIFDDVRMYTINVTIENDKLREPPPDETFTLVLQHSIVEPLNVKLEPSTATINIVDDDLEPIIPVNDTIIGDPLFSVPILVSEDDLKMIGSKLSLCYEVHGARDKIYNMITDKCASVNAHYNDLTSFLNVIDRVGVRATDNKDQCKNIQVDLGGCKASIDGFPMDTYRSEGISVRKYNNRVRIMVPNCNELSLVMWVICETRTLDDPNDDTNTITGDMIKLVVTRGLNFGRKAHGLIGQFWNIPVSVTPYEGSDTDGNPVEQVFVVNITTNGASRGYAGHLYHMTWDRQMTPCLYVGNRQAGPIHEIPYPNDYIIEGKYENYAVPSLFTEDEYGYSLFEGKCLDLPTAATTP